MSGAQVIVAYPREEGWTFNKEHYLSTHMSLVKKYWGKHGLKSFTVTELNGDGPYTYIAVLEFESLEAFGAASADPNTKEVMADIPNFSNVQPVLLNGGIIGSF
ncbi:Nn.00g058720.m01.CDS01 [Neocucurbitaria sp. VM-36]